jgi:hypothetical protein
MFPAFAAMLKLSASRRKVVYSKTLTYTMNTVAARAILQIMFGFANLSTSAPIWTPAAGASAATISAATIVVVETMAEVLADIVAMGMVANFNRDGIMSFLIGDYFYGFFLIWTFDSVLW